VAVTPIQASTRLLAHFDEASGDFLDSSVHRRPPVRGTDVSGFSASSAAYFGTHCLASDGSGTHAAYVARNVPYWTQVPFFVECWLFLTAYRVGQPSHVFGSSLGFDLAVHTASNGGKLIWQVRDATGGAIAIVGVDAVPLNQWIHLLAGTDSDFNRRAFIDGTQELFDDRPLSHTAQPSLVDVGLGGYSVAAGATSITGRMDEARIVMGVPCPTAGFAPPTAPYADIPQSLLQGKRAPAAERLQTSPVPVPNYKAAPSARYLFDFRDGGRGRIYGNVKEQGAPTNLPLRRRVRLFRENEGRFVRETWSDATTGLFAFENIDHTVRYTVVTYDYLNNFRAVIADNLLPEVTP